MRVIGYDYETNGTPGEPGFKPTEIAFAIYDTDHKRIIFNHSTLVDSLDEGEEIVPKIAQMTNLNKALIKSAGADRTSAVGILTEWFKVCDLAVVWNGLFFDKILMEQEAKLANITPKDIPLFDLKKDFDFRHSLYHSGADYGFLNPFPHVAIGDVVSMFEIAERMNINWQAALDLSKSPVLYVETQLPYERRAEASEFGFRFNKPKKVWFKICRQITFEKQKEAYKFTCKTRPATYEDLQA